MKKHLNSEGYPDPTAHEALRNAMSKPPKYRNRKTNGFDSKKEYDRFEELRLIERTGLISELKCQVPFELVPKQGTEREVKYYVDFTYSENGRLIAEDVKSNATRKDKAYIIKRKLFKWRYPAIEFRET